MTDTIKTRAQLEQDFADGQLRGIDAQKLRDFLASMGVGGTMFATEVPLDVTGAWAPLDIFTESIDSRGINEDLATGEFVIGAGADGVFAVDVNLGVNYAAGPTGWIEIAITKNGALTPYHMKRTLTAGGDESMGVLGSGNLAEGDRVGLAVRASGTATLTATVQLRALRG